MSVVRVPVLIVGGGAAGLTTSILLSRAGITSLLVERRPGPSLLPKAHILNQRTMEVFREAAIVDRVTELGAPIELMSKTAWYTSLAGPGPLHGREVGYIDSWGGGALQEKYDASSPCRLTNLPQHWLEPILLAQAQSSPLADLRFRNELLQISETDDGVTAGIQDRTSGATWTVHADYVVAADGGRTVGVLLDQHMEGPRGLVEMVSTHFSADLSDHLPDPAVAIYRFVNPDGPGLVHRGTLVQMGGGGWGRDCREWIFSFSQNPSEQPVTDPDLIVNNLRVMLGITDLRVDVHRVSPWRVEGVVAERYSIGRVYFVGDAAHRHPPAGGLGLNTAVQDAHNLAWKLAWVILGRAGHALLDSYGPERRPIGQSNVSQALKSFFQNHDVDKALGVKPEQSADEGWASLAELLDGGPRQATLRDAVDAAIHAKRHAYQAHGLELGIVYEAGAFVADARTEPEAEVEDAVCDFVPSSRPGSRLPHVWVQVADGQASTLDFAGTRQFAFLSADASHDWRLRLHSLVTARPHIPFTDFQVGSTGGAEEIERWRETTGLNDDEAVLVRPDGHVAWRGPVTVSVDTLASVLDQVLGLDG